MGTVGRREVKGRTGSLPEYDVGDNGRRNVSLACRVSRLRSGFGEGVRVGQGRQRARGRAQMLLQMQSIL